ncbi:MAG: TPM domain-containing protein [Bacteroidetes bacterium]|nr:TPM domain-containing protein [Bacteroidota bacterium]
MSFWKKKPILDQDSQQRIVASIKEAEGKTTGEVRVFVEHRCSYMNAMDRAVELFAQLGMFKTERRNATIVYIAVNDRQFAIFGDTAIYEKAGGPVFWESAAARLKEYLKKDQITDGLCACVNELGKALATHFPYDPAVTKNELPDEIVFGK